MLVRSEVPALQTGGSDLLPPRLEADLPLQRAELVLTISVDALSFGEVVMVLRAFDVSLHLGASKVELSLVADSDIDWCWRLC